jgi:hypothetical protein
LFYTCSIPAPKSRQQQTKPYHKAMTSRDLKNTSITNNGIDTTTSNKQKRSKYFIQYNFKKYKNTTPLAPTTTKGANLRKTKCEE